MKLLGWDTVSAIGVDLANQALEAGETRLLTSFDHNRDGLKIKGRFGPWRICPGGSMRKLHMALFIRTGTATGLTDAGKSKTDISGMTLKIEVPIELVPSPDGVAPAELRFDLDDDGDGPTDGIVPLDLIDPDARMGELDAELVKLALCDCLNKNRSKISFVFASITPGAASQTSWMYTPHLDWALLNTRSGRSYLAVLGSLAPPTSAMEPDKIDPELIAGTGSAYFACSRQIYAQRVLAPWLTANMKPKAKFVPAGNFAKLNGAIRLPDVKTVVGRLRPAITKMAVGPKVGALGIALDTRTPVTKKVTILVQMNITMKMFVDDKGKVGLRKDPRPKVRHAVIGEGLMGSIVAAIVKIILAMTNTNVEQIAVGIAKKFQSINVPAAQPVAWTGTRKFVTTKAKSEECLWFADDRPA